MTDIRKLSLNWNEIDHSIISAINAMQLARDYFHTNSAVVASRPPRQAMAPPLALANPALGRHVIRDEQVSNCFDDAERMLDEVRTRMMIARAILSGAPQFGAAAEPRLPVAVTAKRPDRYMPSLKALLLRWTVAITTAATVAKTNTLRMVGDTAEVISRKWVSRRRISVNPYALVLARAVSRELQRHILVPALRNIPVRMRRGLQRWIHPSRNANSLVKGWAKATAAQPFYARHSVLIHTASAILAGALTIWMASATTVGFPAVAQPQPMAANDASPTPATHSSCAIAAWGKACYPRRNRP